MAAYCNLLSMKFDEIDLIVSEVKKKNDKEGRNKGKRVRKDLRRGGRISVRAEVC